MQPLCVGIRALLLSALLPCPGSGQFHVIGPAEPVIVSVGGEVLLPCHLSPQTDAEDMEVTWYRINPSGLVHHYADFKDIVEQQQPKYRGRTEFRKENITKGQVALKIHSIHTSDDGDYRCLFASSTFEDEARFKVLVTGSGMVPQIHIEPGDTGVVKLTCTSRGWYPEPQVQWREFQGQPLIPTSETRTADRNGLFYVETSVRVNTESKGVSCIMKNPVLSEEKEAHVSVSDAMFPCLCPWILNFTVSLCLLAAGTTIFILFLQTRRKNGSLKKKYDQLYAEKDDLKKEKGDLKIDKDVLKKEKDDLKREKDELKEKNDALKAKNDMLCKEIDDFMMKYDYLTRVEEFINHGRCFPGVGEAPSFAGLSEATNFAGLNEAQRFAEDIVLDQATNHPWLEVSDDGKSVVYVVKKKDLPDDPKRLEDVAAVLGENSFSDGYHYWEVEVEGKKNWIIGLCVESTERKRSKNPQNLKNGVWTIGRQDDVPYPISKLDVQESTLRVGIFLQYKKGLISFYDLTNHSIICIFKGTFNEPLKPYFYLLDK